MALSDSPRGFNFMGQRSVNRYPPPENPFTEPSQYIVQVLVVVLPNEPGVQVMMSEPSPLTPLTLKLPSVVR